MMVDVRLVGFLFVFKEILGIHWITYDFTLLQ